MYNKHLRYVIQSAIFSIIITVLTMLSIPMKTDIPITLQTFGIALCGFLLGPVQALLSVLIYILIGIAGIPVFSNLKGGIETLMGTTGGFIIGFIPMALFCGLGKYIKIQKPITPSSVLKIILALFISITGLAICHILGTRQYAHFKQKTMSEVLSVTSYPFIVKDLLSVIAAYFLSNSINNRLSEHSKK